MKLQRKGEIGALLPTVLEQQVTAGNGITERSRAGTGLECPLAGQQIELSERAPLLPIRDEAAAPVQLIDDLKDVLGGLLGSHAQPQGSTDVQVEG